MSPGYLSLIVLPQPRDLGAATALIPLLSTLARLSRDYVSPTGRPTTHARYLRLVNGGEDIAIASACILTRRFSLLFQYTTDHLPWPAEDADNVAGGAQPQVSAIFPNV